MSKSSRRRADINSLLLSTLSDLPTLAAQVKALIPPASSPSEESFENTSSSQLNQADSATHPSLKEKELQDAAAALRSAERQLELRKLAIDRQEAAVAIKERELQLSAALHHSAMISSLRHCLKCRANVLRSVPDPVAALSPNDPLLVATHAVDRPVVDAFRLALDADLHPLLLFLVDVAIFKSKTPKAAADAMARDIVATYLSATARNRPPLRRAVLRNAPVDRNMFSVEEAQAVAQLTPPFLAFAAERTELVVERMISRGLFADEGVDLLAA
jgi:hypothetical protein